MSNWASFSIEKVPIKSLSATVHNMVRVPCSFISKLSWIDIVDAFCNINIEWCTGAKSISSKQIFSPPQPQNPSSSSLLLQILVSFAQTFREAKYYTPSQLVWVREPRMQSKIVVLILSGVLLPHAASVYLLWTEAKFLVILCTCILSWGPVTWGWPKAAPLYAYSK